MTNLTNTSVRENYFLFCLSWRIVKCGLFIVVVLGIVGGLIGYHYRFHLFWKYQEWRGILPTVHTIPHSPMPEVGIPDEWIDYSWESLRFRLPPVFSINDEVARRINARREQRICLQSDDESYIIHVSSTHIEVPESSIMNVELSIGNALLLNSTKPLTFPRFYLELCKVSSDQFRWSMCADEVQRLYLLCGLRKLSSSPVSSVYLKKSETFFRDDVDGIVLFTNVGSIFWQSTSTTYAGIIVVIDKGGRSEEDFVSFVRKICQSIEVCE